MLPPNGGGHVETHAKLRLLVVLLATLGGGTVLAQAGGARRIDFADRGALAQWTIAGDVALDPARSDTTRGGGALRIGPGGKAALTLRDADGSGAVSMWVYDDGSTPADVKAARVGPRWGVVASDGRMLVVGNFYNSYLGGDEGYTASLSDGKLWFDQLSWLGGNRHKPAWHRWSFSSNRPEPSESCATTSPRRPSPTPPRITSGASAESSCWATPARARGNRSGLPAQQSRSAVRWSLLGPSRPTRTISSSPAMPPPSMRGQSSTPKPTPPMPRLEDLGLESSVGQYGITWTFDRPARVGHFVNGDWYVVGPVKVIAIDPKPLYGQQVPQRELDPIELERPQSQRVRNGFMLNPPAQMKVAYDSGVRNWFDPSLIQKLPVAMTPGDSLVSTISMPEEPGVARPSCGTRSSAARTTAARSERRRC